MKISVVKEDELVNEIQSAKKESLGSMGMIDSDIISMGVVTKDSGIEKIMIGENRTPEVESVSIPNQVVQNENTVSNTSESSNKNNLSLDGLKNKFKSNKNKKSSQNKKDNKLGL